MEDPQRRPEEDPQAEKTDEDTEGHAVRFRFRGDDDEEGGRGEAETTKDEGESRRKFH